jgi:hypothetical protein
MKVFLPIIQTTLSRQSLALIAGFALLTLLRLLFPGDIRFGPDEAMLIENALDANSRHTLVTHGLMGTRGLAYGPLPTWAFQLAILFTQDVIAIAMLKILLVSVITSGALLWIARTCRRLTPIIGLLALCSPYLWLYSRDMWDNSMNIAVTALAIAAYLSFMERHRIGALLLTALCCTAALLIHFMALPVVLAIAMHALLFLDVPWVKKHALHVTGITALCVLIASPYIIHLFTLSSFDLPAETAADSALFMLTGWKFFSVYGLEYFMGEGWQNPLPLPLRIFLQSSTFIAAALCLAGFMEAMRTIFMAAKTRSWDNYAHLSLLSMLLITLHLLLCVWMNLGTHPHYFNAAWTAYFLLLWIGASVLCKWTAGKILLSLYAASLLTTVILLLLQLHAFSGNRAYHFGPTIENQIEIAHTLNGYEKDVPVQSNVEFYKNFPKTLTILRRLYPYEGTAKRLPGSIIIDYESTNDRSGKVMVREN